MGKKGEPWRRRGEEQAWEDDWQQPSWRLWRGGAAASPKGRGQPPWRPDTRRPRQAPKPVEFPAYDTKKIDTAAIVPISEKKLSSTAAPGKSPTLLKAIQTAVNFTRKHETRVNRLERELADGKLQWESYVQDMKNTLRTEKARFVQEQTRVTEALKEAQDQQKLAYQQLSQVFTNGGPPSESTAMEVTDEMEEWKEVLAGLDEGSGGSGGPDIGVLLDALRKAGIPLEMPESEPSTPPRRVVVPPATTPPSTTKDAARSRLTPEGLNTPSPRRVEDPYLSSPGLAHFGMPLGGPTGDGAPSNASPGGQAAVGNDHSGDAEATRATGGSPHLLADRLSEKRRVSRSALAPFGLAKNRKTDAGSDGPPGLVPDTGQTSSVIDDDDSEELDAAAAVETRAPSPGRRDPVITTLALPCAGVPVSVVFAFGDDVVSEQQVPKGLPLGRSLAACRFRRPLVPPPPGPARTEVIMLEHLTALPEPTGESDAEWLGVTVFTPHVRPLRLAVLCPPHHDIDHVIDAVLHASPDDAEGIYDRCVPACPLQFRGWCTLIRFPSIASQTPAGVMRAVIVDLTYVGGHHYACLLPEEIPFEELLHFATMQADYSEVEILIHVGNNPAAHSPEVPLRLRDGDVLSFRRPPQEWHVRQTASELLQDVSSWQPPLDMPRLTPSIGVLVHYGPERVFMPRHHHYGQSPMSAIASMWDFAAGEYTVCVFPTPDLEFRGNPCTQAASVVSLPSAQLHAAPACRRRDFFTLCDFRGLGYGVRIAHSTVPLLHLPSVAAIAGVHVPLGKRLVAIGWEALEDDLRLYGNDAFVIKAIPEALPISLADPPDRLDAPPDAPRDSNPGGGSFPFSVTPGAPERHGRRPFTRERSRSRDRQDTDWGYHGSLLDANKPGICEPPLCPRFLLQGDCSFGSLCYDSYCCADPFVPATHKLLREPASHSVAQHARVGHAREFVRQTGRPWGYLPADGDPDEVTGDDEGSESETAALGEGEAEFTFFVLRIEYVPEIVTLVLEAPVLVQDALALESGILISLPGWASTEAALLRLCEITNGEEVDIYVGTSEVALGDEEVPLHQGLCVFVVRRFAFPGPFFLLRDILQNSATWDAEPQLPIGPAGGGFCAVGEQGHRRSPVAPTAAFPDHDAIAEAFAIPAQELIIQPVVPTLGDVALHGVYCRNVCAVSASRDPDTLRPVPALQVTVVDCRALLQGWLLLASVDGRIDRADLENVLLTFAPPGWELHLEGLVQTDRERDDSEALSNSDMSVDVPEVVLPEGVIEEAYAVFVPHSDGWDVSDEVPCAAGEWAYVIGDDGPLQLPCFSSHVQMFVIMLMLVAVPTLLSRLLREQCGRALPHGRQLAIRGGMRMVLAITTILETALEGERLALHMHLWKKTAHSIFVRTGREVMCSAAQCVPCLSWKILREPDTSSPDAERSLDAARTATRALGQRWPFDPAWLPLFPLQEEEPSDISEEALVSDDVIDAVFCLFTPGYVPEVLPLTVVIPQAVPDLVDLIQTCRHREHAQNFPTLVPTWPQSNPAWGAFVAVPAWLQNRPIVCLDLSLWDGRVFAVDTPDVVDKFRLLQLAGLHIAAEIDIFLPDAIEPVPAGGDFQVRTGMSLVFAPHGQMPPPTFELREMLQTPQHWHPHPHLPFAHVPEHYLVATGEGNHPFRLLAERSMYLRSDLAARFDIPIRDLRLQPAQPRQHDASIHGHCCRNVVVLSSQSHPPTDFDEIVCLVDGRALLIGWLPLHTDRGHINLNFVRAVLRHSTPEGWEVSLHEVLPRRELPLEMQEEMDLPIRGICDCKVVPPHTAFLLVIVAHQRRIGISAVLAFLVAGERHGACAVRTPMRVETGLPGVLCSFPVTIPEARPLPTPCRSLHAIPPDVSDEGPTGRPETGDIPRTWVPDLYDGLLIDIGPTLLEECLRDDDTALWEASTLIETLLEHFAATTDRHFPETEIRAANPLRGPSPICLATAVAPPSFDLTAQSVSMPHRDDLITTILTCWPFAWYVPDATSLPLPSVTAQHIRDWPAWEDLCRASAVPSPVMAPDFYRRLLDAPPALRNEEVWFDCFAAGKTASGEWTASTPFARQIRDLQLWAETMLAGALQYRHVKAHQGHPLNELADHLAKLAAAGKKPNAPPPAHVVTSFLQLDASWIPAALIDNGRKILPFSPDGHMLRWEGTPASSPCKLSPSDIVPICERTIGATPDSATDLAVRAATVNVQGVQDRAPYLEAQFDEQGLQVVFLQEAKTASGVCHTKLYMRLTTESHRHFGVSIWISKRLGIATLNGQPILVRESDLCIQAESERLLVIVATVADIQLALFSGHCPHSGQREEAAKFITGLQGVLGPLKRSSVLLGGIDLNGRPPRDVTGVTGGLIQGEVDDTGREFAHALQTLHAWLPSTYHRLHVGSSTTFVHPSGTEHRIDFIVIGGKLVVEEARSEVLRQVDLGAVRDDHFLVSCTLRGVLDHHGHLRTLWRPRFDVDKMMTTEGRAIISAEVKKFQSPSWDVHPDEHCRQLTAHLQQVMESHFQFAVSRPRASFIPAEVWDCRAAKISLKCRSRHRAKLWSDLVVRAFLQWKTASDYSVCVAIAREGLLYQLNAAAIRFASARIRGDIRRAKATFLQNLVLKGGDRAPDILGTAKKAGIGGAKCRKPFKPMPHLLDSNGRPAGTRADRDQVWLEHFGKQEYGRVIPVDRFLTMTPESLVVDAELEWCSHHLPSLREVEDVLRGLPRHKAAGLDAVPAELLRASPGPMSRVLHPLYTKSMLCLRQPLQWRGGLLFEAWKQSGSQKDAASYRSLYVASVVGKAYHKLQRRKIQPEAEATLHEFHMGARKGTPVVMPALYVLASQRAGAESRSSSAVLFLDTHAAYYRIVRDLALGCIYDDAMVVRLFEHFSLDASELQEMMEVVCQGGTFADNHVPETIRHAAKDTHHFTWFVTPHTSGSLLCKTEAGSRPGESWADTIFSFVYSRVLARIAEIARGEDLLPEFAVDTDTGPFAKAGEGELITGQDATWADDSAWPLIAPAPEQLLRKATRLASIVLEQCAAHGMQPNLGRNKTALMCALRGKGAVKAARQYFDHGRAALHLPELGLDLPVTNQYKHLGGVIDHRLRLNAEARRRLAMATQAFDQGKALLYLNSTLPLHTRASLLQIAVTSTYHNLPIWNPAGPSWEALEGGYTRLVRRLLSKAIPGDLLFKLPAALAHVMTGCPPMPFLARKARLSLLSSMCATGPKALWAALQTEQTWFTTVRADLQWLAATVRQDWPMLVGAAWPQWRQLLTTRTAWFKRQVRAGLQIDMERFAKQQAVCAVLWALHRYAKTARPIATEITGRRWYCGPCERAFKTKAALGAHFFKSHGRRARYRAVVDGTLCQACGRQFWSTNRLSRHLRDAPACVATLRAHRLFSKSMQPGVGSKQWRKNAVEQFHPSTPQPRTAGLPPQAGNDWDEVQKAAHLDLCETLLTPALPPEQGAIASQLRAVLGRYPLFEDEAKDLLEFVWHETKEVRAEIVGDTWPQDTEAAVDAAFADLLTSVWGPSVDWTTEASAHASFRDLERSVAHVDWAALRPNGPSFHVTPSDHQFVLAATWEADLVASCKVIDASAVRDHLWAIVPGALRGAWIDVQNGLKPSLAAPRTFWQSRLAAPFAHLASSSLAT
ncbi:unnamed protein product [Symbiodinium sp. CCMP2592]|nr:unnamed protein product [Symbiodinium sp. CCMP2592]